MIDKNVNYNDKDFSKHLKGLGLSKEEIKYILGETKRKKFEDGGDSSSSSDSSSSDSSSDSGPGGSDEGSGHGGPGPGSSAGESTGDANDQGGTAAPGPSDTSSVGPSTEGFGIGPNAEAEAEASNAENANMGVMGVVDTVTGFAKQSIQNAINNPVATALGMVNPALGFAYGQISKAVDAANRGVTAPDDYSQLTESVQTNTQSPTSGGGIGTIQTYAPLYNQDTGNPTMDAYMRKLRINLGLPV
jgi:hypothetical protein